MAVSKEDFRRGMGSFASGVSVVTARLGNINAGITVTAFSSLSLDPPLVLVCIDRRARMHDPLAIGSAFAVNLLAADQEDLSRRFASSSGDQFAGVDFLLGAQGAPVLQGTVAAIECVVVDRLPGGDHTIIVGQVEKVTAWDAQPLVYFRGKYARLA